jgi:hypothetical protein
VRARSIMARHTISLGLLVVYLTARSRFIGHPLRTHAHATSFPLPPNAELWAFLWDAVLLVVCLSGVLSIRRIPRLRLALPPNSDWMVLWCGLMALPAVHFCSQVTLRPWFLDERYWYVPLLPLSVFAGSLLSHGGSISSILGAVILGLALPLPLGPFMAGMALLVAGPLRLLHRDVEVQAVIVALFGAALATLLWNGCREIRLRADEAANVHRQITRVVQETPAGRPIALLNFTEETVEPRRSFNGDLQWLLQPPFFAEDLNLRLFFAYPTWDSPPTNRFRDRTTGDLANVLLSGIHTARVYFWEPQRREFVFVGVRGVRPERNPSAGEAQELAMNPGRVERDTRWSSKGLNVDPRQYRSLSIRLVRDQGFHVARDPQVTVGWLAQSSHFLHGESLQLSLTGLGQVLTTPPIRMKLEFPAAKYVDWLMSEKIAEVRVTADEGFRILAAAMPTRLFDKTVSPEAGLALTHYRYPERRFLQIGETRLTFELQAVSP